MTGTTLANYMANCYNLGARVIRLPGDDSSTVVQRLVTAAQNAGLQVNLLFVGNTTPSFIQSVVATYYPQG